MFKWIRGIFRIATAFPGTRTAFAVGSVGALVPILFSKFGRISAWRRCVV